MAPGMLAGKPHPLLGHSRHVPSGQLGSLQPSHGPPVGRMIPEMPPRGVQSSWAPWGYAKPLSRPRVQGPGHEWGDPHLALSSHLGPESGSTGGRGPALDVESHRHILLRDVWRDGTLVCPSRDLGPQCLGVLRGGIANSQTGLSRSSGSAFLWEQPHISIGQL